jgi:hypothetical protein
MTYRAFSTSARSLARLTAKPKPKLVPDSEKLLSGTDWTEFIDNRAQYKRLGIYFSRGKVFEQC